MPSHFCLLPFYFCLPLYELGFPSLSPSVTPNQRPADVRRRIGRKSDSSGVAPSLQTVSGVRQSPAPPRRALANEHVGWRRTMFEVKSGRADTWRKSRRSEGGFTAIEVLLVLAVVAIVATLAVMTMARARDNVRLTGAARELAAYIEKARLDSIRRHELGGAAVVTLTSANTYRVLMDFAGSGTPVTRNFTLPDGVSFTNNPLPPAITFNWRGRTDADTRITLRNSQQEEEVVSVTIGGEVSVGREVIALETPGSTAVDPDADLNSAIPNGATNGGTTTTTSGTSSTTTGRRPAPPRGRRPARRPAPRAEPRAEPRPAAPPARRAAPPRGRRVARPPARRVEPRAAPRVARRAARQVGRQAEPRVGTTSGTTSGTPPATCTISAASSSMDVKKNTSETIVVTMTGSTTVSAS